MCTSKLEFNLFSSKFIICSPFLTHFFSRVSILKEKKWVTKGIRIIFECQNWFDVPFFLCCEHIFTRYILLFLQQQKKMKYSLLFPILSSSKSRSSSTHKRLNRFACFWGENSSIFTLLSLLFTFFFSFFFCRLITSIHSLVLLYSCVLYHIFIYFYMPLCCR